jgi:hypothetical protein
MINETGAPEDTPAAGSAREMASVGDGFSGKIVISQMPAMLKQSKGIHDTAL